MEPTQEKKTFKLRYISRRKDNTEKVEKEAIIENNLGVLKQNTKKQIAQDLYYSGNSNHISPLKRTPKLPVHQRLGKGKFSYRRSLPLGTNTSTLLPKWNFINKNTPQSFRMHRLQRSYSAQARLDRIRSNQSNQNERNAPIILKRLKRIPPATNLTIQVTNPEYCEQKTHSEVRFKMILDPQLQLEINEIQLENRSNDRDILPIARITPVCTSIALTTRFALL